MKCPNCQHDVESSAAFCGNCGFRLQQPAQTQPEAATPSVVPPVPATPTPPVESTISQPTTVMPAATPAVVSAAPSLPTALPEPGQVVPAYAMGQPRTIKGSGLLTTALVLAILSVPGAIVPLVGVVFSITAIVLASKHHNAGTGRMVASVVIGSIGLLLSLVGWGYNISQRAKQTGFAPSNSAVTSISTVTHTALPYRTLVTINH